MFVLVLEGPCESSRATISTASRQSRVGVFRAILTEQRTIGVTQAPQRVGGK
jgi:hypothetical protein